MRTCRYCHRYITLRWKLLEYKAMYYLPEKVHKSWHKRVTISDTEYDGLEREMKALNADLGFNDDWAVGFPSETPSGQLVLKKLGKRVPRYKAYR